GDSSAIGACRSPAARTDTEEGQIVSPWEAGSTALPLRLVMSGPLGMTKSPSGGCLGDNNQAWAWGASCKNARSTEKENHSQVINRNAQVALQLPSHAPGDNAAGHLDLKIRERKARMFGDDSHPTTSAAKIATSLRVSTTAHLAPVR